MAEPGITGARLLGDFVMTKWRKVGRIVLAFSIGYPVKTQRHLVIYVAFHKNTPKKQNTPV